MQQWVRASQSQLSSEFTQGWEGNRVIFHFTAWVGRGPERGRDGLSPDQSRSSPGGSLWPTMILWGQVPKTVEVASILSTQGLIFPADCSDLWIHQWAAPVCICWIHGALEMRIPSTRGLCGWPHAQHSCPWTRLSYGLIRTWGHGLRPLLSDLSVYGFSLEEQNWNPRGEPYSSPAVLQHFCLRTSSYP